MPHYDKFEALTFSEICDLPDEEFKAQLGDGLPMASLWAMESRAFDLMLKEYDTQVGQSLTIADQVAPRSKRQGAIAVIPIRGVMTKRPSFFSMFFGSGLGSTVEARMMVKKAGEDPNIGSILLLVDSPGGSVEGLHELVDQVKLTEKEKPIVAQVDGTAASAAIHVISQATEIFAHRMDQVGSIGTRMTVVDFSQQLENDGVKVHVIDSGKFKSAGSPGTEVLPEHLDYFQSIVDTYTDDFVGAVAEGRGMSVDEVSKLADGKMFFATDAVRSGLIDGIQTTDETLTAMSSGAVIGVEASAENAQRHRRLDMLNHGISYLSD